MLRRMEQSSTERFPVEENEALKAYQTYMCREMSVDQFVESLARFSRYRWYCPCGVSNAANQKCQNWRKHLEINLEIRDRFKKGDRVLYNYHAYPPDCPGRVAAHVPLKPENGTYPWAWISIKFDHLKGARQIPIFSAKGWHLKHAVIEVVEV